MMCFAVAQFWGREEFRGTRRVDTGTALRVAAVLEARGCATGEMCGTTKVQCALRGSIGDCSGGAEAVDDRLHLREIMEALVTVTGTVLMLGKVPNEENPICQRYHPSSLNSVGMGGKAKL